MTLHFRARLEINGINPYVLVSADQAALLKQGWRKPMPVRVQVNGKPDTPWRINMMPVGDGGFFLYLHGQVRKASGASVGDVASITVMFDDDYEPGPAHLMPGWFSDELDRDPDARRGWEALTPSRQKEIVRYLTSLKSPEARERNVRKAIGVLAGDRSRFMARDWNVEPDE